MAGHALHLTIGHPHLARAATSIAGALAMTIGPLQFRVGLTPTIFHHSAAWRPSTSHTKAMPPAKPSKTLPFR